MTYSDNKNTDKKTTVLLGNFGSGKSELALNFAISAASLGQKSVLVDLDLINPYFRSSDLEELLKEKNVSLIKPLFANTGVEAPSLPPDIYAVFIDDNRSVVFDVGGDPAGAIALGQYRANFSTLSNLDVLFVINTKRPLSGNADAVLNLIDSISSVSRLEITGLINNTNLSNITTPDDILEGHDIVSQVSKQTEIPVKYTVCDESILDALTEKINSRPDKADFGEILPITRYMRRDWERFVDSVGQ